jgi:hypothetical protein
LKDFNQKDVLSATKKTIQRKIMSTKNSENSTPPNTAELIEKEIKLLSLEVQIDNVVKEAHETYRIARIIALSTLGFIVTATLAAAFFAFLSNAQTISALSQRELIFKVSVPALASAGIVGVIAGRRSQ